MLQITEQNISLKLAFQKKHGRQLRLKRLGRPQ